MDNHTTHNGAALPYGSTFRPPPLPPPNPPPPVPGPPGFVDPMKPRGGVQVLPPVIPPRGPVKSKPKPPVPPKRDQLTRLTTVPGPTPRDEAKPLEALERKINSSSPPNKPVRKPNYENTYQMDPPLSSYDNKILPNSSSRTSFKDSPKESSSEEEGATADIWVRAIDSPVKKPDRMFRSNSTSDDQRQTKAKLVHRASIDNAFIKSPPLKKVPQKPQAIAEQKESDSKDDCRPEETPFPKFEENIFLKNDEKLTSDRSFFKSNAKSDDKVQHGEKVTHNIADSSLPPLPKFDEEVVKPDVEVTSANEDDGASDTEKSRVELERFKIEGREGERLKVGLDALSGSRPGSRATSRSSSPFGERERKKISAAEALGVVAKPCPRPPPGKRVKNQVEFRRQSLGNLSDSKLSMGCSTSCPSHQLWSSFGECQENEYRRHERARGQSADSRTLQRLKSDNWETQSYSSTLSRIGKYSTSKYFAKTATCPDRSAACPAAANPGSGERPKSVCNCGRHTTGSVTTTRDVGKRTFSVEELRSGGFVRGSSTTGSARSSFGKSPRVTFALSEDEGASGSSKYGDGGGGDPRRMSGRARSYDADDRFQNNRSQPPGGPKQAQKTRMDDTEIQATVESILGKGAKVVDCEKKSTIREEEVLLVNGCPIRLDGAEGAVIREALMHGTAPHSDLLNQILIRAGVLSTPVRLETSLSVKSSVVTREHITIAKGGKVIDGRSRETKEDNFYNSSTAELWEPVRAPSSSSGSTKVSSSASTTSEAPVWEPITSQSSLTSISKGPTSTSVASTTLSSSTSNSTSESFDDLEPPHDRLDGLSLLTDLTSLNSLSQSTPPGVSNGSDTPVSQDATPSPDNAMMFREGNLVSGRLEALVMHLVPTADYYPDRAFLFAFLLTSRLFIKPHDLLGQILALSDAQLKSKQSPKERAALLPRMVQLLGEWSETFPYDFRDERVMSHVRDVAHRCVSVEGPVRQEVSLLLHNLLYRLKKLEQYEAFLHSIHTEATTSSLESLSQTDVNELCGSAECLAQQLTHIELERLSYIGPEEFVQAFAKESPALETSFKDMKQTRNLESYVSWFNRLSYFVATEVCKHIKSKKQRVRVVEFWVETARECFNIGNFNSLMAIIAGLNMSPISRLKRTWSKVQCAKFSVLEHQMDPSSNFSSYRSTLKAAVWRSAAATDDSQRIVIPFFSLLVKDLYFLNEGCSNKLPNGHINFEKFWQLAKQVTEFITWKQVHCPFPKAAKVITYLQATPVLNEDALALASFECEPPENHEKDRYKSLKAEFEKSGSN